MGFLRHPRYLAVLILIWARDLAVANFIVNGIVIGYIVVGTRLEERKLAMDIGVVYEDYQRRVSMLVPLKWILQRVKGSTKSTNEKVYWKPRGNRYKKNRSWWRVATRCSWLAMARGLETYRRHCEQIDLDLLYLSMPLMSGKEMLEELCTM